MDNGLATTSKGLKWMVIGVLVMVAGYLLMMGGGSKDPQVFNLAMFDWQRLVAAPTVILCGVVTEIVAIMRVAKDKKEE
ncbi:MAG: DUF3098 domain-containing protein [Bacteroidales bacterium]|nr:DUF3098 domain-containing protein [Bacteroidales bacterium]